MDISRPDKLLAMTGLVLLVAPGLIFWGRLPDPVATHWFNGQPDGHLPKLGWIIGSVVVWALLWSVYLFVREKAPSTWKSPFTFGVIGAMAFAQATIVEANLDASSWTLSDALDQNLATIGFLGSWLIFGLLTYAVERR